MAQSRWHIKFNHHNYSNEKKTWSSAEKKENIEGLETIQEEQTWNEQPSKIFVPFWKRH